MTNAEQGFDVVVIGGGLAGGLTAEGLARQGKRVVVLERSAHPGGRARSQAQGEHRFNFGPHAIYRKGPMHRALLAAGVPVSGVSPSIGGARALFADGRLDALPLGLGGVLRAEWFSTRDVPDFLRALRAVRNPGRAATALNETSAAAWMDSLATRESTRKLLSVMVRLATYGGDPEVMSADVAQLQLAAAVGSGVVYVHGGWQGLADALMARVQQVGAQLRHARAASLSLGAGGESGAGGSRHRVVDADGTAYLARDVVFACAPHVALGLLGDAVPELTAFTRWARPVTMRCVDLGTRGSAGLPFTLGVDVPFYFSPQRGVQGMGPGGTTNVHAAWYLGAEAPSEAPSEAGSEASARSAAQESTRDTATRLDEAIARVVPDLADRLLERRVLPRAVVHHALPEHAHGGLLGRPACRASVPGVWFAGDWVGPEGHLADAVASSALSVVRGIAAPVAASQEGGLRFAS